MKQKIDKKNKSSCIKYSAEEVSALLKTLDDEYNSKFSIKAFISNKNNDILLLKENEKLYYYNYVRYMLYEFNSKIPNMMILYINKNNSFPINYQKEQNFRAKLINLFKFLLMNEIEVSFFTILLDTIGWSYSNLDHWVYFSILGIITKKMCGNENILFLLIDIISRKNSKFIEQYTSFINDENIKNKINQININNKIINKRFNQLSNPINTYCKKNFIKLEGIIDEIIKMSQPYSKNNIKRKGRQKKQKKITKLKINDSNNNKNEKRKNSNISFEISQFSESINSINKDKNEPNLNNINYAGNLIYQDFNDLEIIDFESLNMILSNPALIDCLKFDDI